MKLDEAKEYGPKVNALLARMRGAGVSRKFLRRVMPDWVTPGAERSPGALDELKVSLARRLGLDLRALIERDAVEFAVPAHVRYKGARAVSDAGARSPFVAYCAAVARGVASALARDSSVPARAGADERAAILSDAAVKWVSLNALLRRCWEDLGVAVVHVGDGPVTKRGFDAATFRFGERYVIVVVKAIPHPSWAAFIVAHELGHVAGGHLGDGEVIVDDDPSEAVERDDAEERFADRFALEVLGERGLRSVTAQGPPSAAGLAKAALEAGARARTDPGHLVLRYARESGDWSLGQAALRRLRGDGPAVSREMNDIAARFLDFDFLGDDARTLTEKATGLAG